MVGVIDPVVGVVDAVWLSTVTGVTSMMVVASRPEYSWTARDRQSALVVQDTVTVFAPELADRQ